MSARSIQIWFLLTGIVLLGCPTPFEPATSASATDADDAATSDTRGLPDTTTGLSATSVGETLPPPPPTTGADEGDPIFDVGATSGADDCVEGELQCDVSIEPFLLVCEGGSWKRVPQSHSSAAGDCDGVCREDGALLASDCIDDACVCDRPCPGSAKELSWQDGYCANGSTFWNCVAGQWGAIVCEDACKDFSCSAARGHCEAGAFGGKDEHYDTCLCDFSDCGSCRQRCGLADAVPDGDGDCYCDAQCVDYGDCCYDYDDECAKGLGPDHAEETYVLPGEPLDRAPVEAALALSTWPSLRAYPILPAALVEGLSTHDPARVLSGLRDAFATEEWPSEHRWNRFGAIDLGNAPAFVSLEDGASMPLRRLSLGCLGGFVEAARLLAAPELDLDAVLAPARACPEDDADADAPAPCSDENHTGLHVLFNLRDLHHEGWTIDLVDPGTVGELRRAFGASPDPYYVSASHVARRDGTRRYHHMMVVLVDAEAGVNGPMVFDVTGGRGVSFRRVSWRELALYIGVTLTRSDRFHYARGTNRIAVLHSSRVR